MWESTISWQITVTTQLIPELSLSLDISNKHTEYTENILFRILFRPRCRSEPSRSYNTTFGSRWHNRFTGHGNSYAMWPATAVEAADVSCRVHIAPAWTKLHLPPPPPPPQPERQVANTSLSNVGPRMATATSVLHLKIDHFGRWSSSTTGKFLFNYDFYGASGHVLPCPWPHSLALHVVQMLIRDSRLVCYARASRT